MPSPDDAQVEQFATSVAQLFRVLRSARRGMPQVHPAVDPMSYPVLYALAGEPQRISQVAARTFSDVSTVSRKVSVLAGHGLIEKVTDPDDGRAQLVTLSPAGRDLLEVLNRQRAELFAGFLNGWDPGEVAAFTGYVERLTTAAEQHCARGVGAR